MMTAEAELEPYVLGLDLGVESVGWAVIDLDQDGTPCGIRRAGVRCFDSGVEGQIESGRDHPRNTKRRKARLQRRQLWRRARRHGKLFGVLQRAGLLPPGPGRSSEDRHKLLFDLDRSLAGRYPADEDRAAAQLLPYRIRAKALDEPLEPFALGRALYHLGQRRGFLSNRKAVKDADEEGQVKAAIGELRRKMQQAAARTLGEYFAGLDAEEERVRGRWTSRQMYEEEFEAIWSAQAPHHAALTPELKREVHDAIFRQRKLKSQKGLIGFCELEPECRRAPWACLDAQRFRFLQRVNDLEVIAPDGEIRPLTAQERDKLINALDTGGDLTFAAIRKLLGLNKPRGYSFNLEEGGEKKLVGNRTAAKFVAAIGKGRWADLSEADRDRLVEDLLSFEKTDPLVQRLIRAWGFSEAEAVQIAEIQLEPDYCRLSRRALRRVVPLLERGEHYATTRKKLYGDRLAEAETVDLLPPVADASAELRNPVVKRALTELRKVVNALLRRYGKPALVRVELARDMKRSRAARKDASQRNRQNERAREEAKKKILVELGNEHPSRADVEKLLLAKECGWHCPYTHEEISMATLLGPSPQFDVEHIIPFSRSLDNSFRNKTLCYHEENRTRKRNRTPVEAYAGSAQWDEILGRVRKFKGSMAAAKLRQFQLKEIPEDFASRQLNDTRYISRLAGEYLGLLYGGRTDADGKLRVQVSSGPVTAYLRNRWGLNAILGEGPRKERTDHRHHAVDAIAIALTSPSTVKLLSDAAQRADAWGGRLFVPIDPPWDGFLDQARHAVDAICVSWRVDRRVAGALHKETLYGKSHPAPDARGRPVECRHLRKPLVDMSIGEIDSIVDDQVRWMVQGKLQQLGGTPKQAFADPANLPYFRTKDGRIIPIRKARIRQNVTTVELAGRGAPRFVAPGDNHHMEIVAATDAKGHTKWEGHLVTLMEAARRARSGEPVVRRDHGRGKKFLFSLANNDYVVMEHHPGEVQLYRVVVITESQVEFRLHTDARPTTVVKKIPGARVRRSPGKLLEAKARKVAVDPLGNILPAND